MYDVLVIGAGPAGIFAAMEVVETEPGARVLVLDKGPEVGRRACPGVRKESGCIRCRPCLLLCGWGGAGAFSDGKLTLTSEFGGFLGEYIGDEEVARLIKRVDDMYVRFGATEEVYGARNEVFKDLQRQAASANLNLIPAPIRHLGTDNCQEVTARLHEYLRDRIDIRLSTTVASIMTKEEGGRRAAGVVTADGEEIEARFVVAAPGRGGAEWFSGEAKRLGLHLGSNPVDIGVRVEIPAVIMEHITDRIYESKLTYQSKSFDDPVRTFCMCPHGEVVLENNEGIVTVNGHSFSNVKTENTNFAILVSKSFTEPFKEPIAYGKHIASLANLLGGGVIVQRLGDLHAGRRSTRKRLSRAVKPTLPEATPGDLSLVLPYRHLVDIMEMLEALDKLAPGVNSGSTLLYGVEVKFYSSRWEVSKELESGVENLFVAGDGAGITRGLAQASASGIHVARAILKRL